jgi:hypothetical protein
MFDDLQTALAMFPLFEKRKKRGRYRLLPSAREAHRQRIMRVKPWKKSTGPKTELGKMISNQNGLKHGYYARDAGVSGRAYRAAYHQVYRFQTGRNRTAVLKLRPVKSF